MENKICYKCEKEIDLSKEICLEQEFKYYHPACLGVKMSGKVDPVFFISVQDISGKERVRYCLKAENLDEVMKGLDELVYGSK